MAEPASTRSTSRPIRWPRPGAPEFTFTYTSEGGPDFAPGVSERWWSLTVDSRTAECVLERRRSDADVGGEPIGRFWASMTDDELREVQGRVRGAALSTRTPKPKGNPGSSLQTIDWWEPAGRTTLRFDSTDRELSGAIWPLMEKVFELIGKASEAPESAVVVEAGGKAGQGSPLLWMRLRNVGTGKVAVNDPRRGPVLPQRFAVVRVAPKPEIRKGVTPPQPRWREIPIPQAEEVGKVIGEADEPVRVLGPGESLELGPAVWLSPPRGVAHWIQAVWSDYTGDPTFNGVIRARGAACSTWVEFTP